MDDLAFLPDDIETFAEPVAFHGRVQSPPIKPIPPLEDIFTGQPLGRILDLLGCFARAGLAPGGHAPVEDALWLGNSLGILREFMVLKSDHRWVDSMIEALERIPGQAQADIVSRLRAMRSERWPFARGTWVELLSLIDGIGKAEPQAGEVKPVPLAGKKRGRKRKGPTVSDLASLAQKFGSDLYGESAQWFADRLELPVSTVKDSELWVNVIRMRGAAQKEAQRRKESREDGRNCKEE